MSSQALMESMARRVDEQRAEILANAGTEAEAIARGAQAQSAALREQTIAATHAELAVLKERSELLAQAEAAKAALSMKNVAVEAVLDTVKARIRSLVASDTFGPVLESLLAELMEVAEGEVVVVAPAAHVDRVKSWLAAHGHASVPVQAQAGLQDGVALQDPKRTYRVSNTLSTRYALVDQEARKICMTSLFSD